MRYAIISPVEREFTENYENNMYSVMFETPSGVKYFSIDKANDDWNNDRSRQMFKSDREQGGKLEDHVPQNSTYYTTEIGEYSGANKAKVDYLLGKFGYEIPDEKQLAL